MNYNLLIFILLFYGPKRCALSVHENCNSEFEKNPIKSTILEIESQLPAYLNG